MKLADHIADLQPADAVSVLLVYAVFKVRATAAAAAAAALAAAVAASAAAAAVKAAEEAGADACKGCAMLRTAKPRTAYKCSAQVQHVSYSHHWGTSRRQDTCCPG